MCLLGFDVVDICFSPNFRLNHPRTVSRPVGCLWLQLLRRPVVVVPSQVPAGMPVLLSCCVGLVRVRCHVTACIRAWVIPSEINTTNPAIPQIVIGSIAPSGPVHATLNQVDWRWVSLHGALGVVFFAAVLPMRP